MASVTIGKTNVWCLVIKHCDWGPSLIRIRYLTYSTDLTLALGIKIIYENDFITRNQNPGQTEKGWAILIFVYFEP